MPKKLRQFSYDEHRNIVAVMGQAASKVAIIFRVTKGRIIAKDSTRLIRLMRRIDEIVEVLARYRPANDWYYPDEEDERGDGKCDTGAGEVASFDAERSRFLALLRAREEKIDLAGKIATGQLVDNARMMQVVREQLLAFHLRRLKMPHHRVLATKSVDDVVEEIGKICDTVKKNLK